MWCAGVSGLLAFFFAVTCIPLASRFTELLLTAEIFTNTAQVLVVAIVACPVGRHPALKNDPTVMLRLRILEELWVMSTTPAKIRMFSLCVLTPCAEYQNLGALFRSHSWFLIIRFSLSSSIGSSVPKIETGT
jgi:hypothetical protein